MICGGVRWSRDDLHIYASVKAIMLVLGCSSVANWFAVNGYNRGDQEINSHFRDKNRLSVVFSLKG